MKMEKLKNSKRNALHLLASFICVVILIITTTFCSLSYFYFHDWFKNSASSVPIAEIGISSRLKPGPAEIGNVHWSSSSTSELELLRIGQNTTNPILDEDATAVPPLPYSVSQNENRNESSWSGGRVLDNRLLLESIKRGNSMVKLRRELIYIYKLPPVTDQDYEHEELVTLHSGKRGKKTLGGVSFFDDLDTGDYLTDDNLKSRTHHRFTKSRTQEINNNKYDSLQSLQANNIQDHHVVSHKHHANINGRNSSGIETETNANDSSFLKKDKSVFPSPQSLIKRTPHQEKRNNDSALLLDSHRSESSASLPSLPNSNKISSLDSRQILTLPTNVQNEEIFKGNGSKGRNGESLRRKIKYYNTGHFRKSHAVIWDPHPQYTFHAFGHRFHLMLTLIPQRHSFLAPHFSITTHSTRGSNNSRESFIRRENLKEKISGCFYKGFVLGDPQSSVAVSLCHGMTGHIRTSHGSYFIEPLHPNSQDDMNHKKKKTGSESDPEEEQILHEIYQVGLSNPHEKESNVSHENESEGSSYESSNNLQLGIPSYDDEDEDDYYWLNPRITRAKLSEPTHKGKSRTKRWSNSQERFVELAVVTDASMSAYHGDNLRHYVLTLLSIVALIYKDASIGNPINIALISFHSLPEESFASNKWAADNATSSESMPGISASEMLRNFCKWQKEHNKPDDGSSEHHDTALLLTRDTICRNPWMNKCDTLGLAELGTMCDNYASCAIVQDNGLSAAFTIAHELGHVMNMPHDDDYKCQSFLESQALNPTHQSSTSESSPNPKEPQHYVMSRMLDHNTYPWAWSRCSRHFLTEFLDAGHGKCLEDEPASNLLIGDGDNLHSGNLLDNSIQQPGEIFSEHKQCELVFGPSSKLCSYMPQCKRLWCNTGNSTEDTEGCRTQHMPWADGTPCGTGGNNWCQRGVCVKKDLEKLKTVNGGWGPWLEFGSCSRNCGGGIRKSYRECDNPRPSNGGKYCIGPRVRYESCNTHECPNQVDFRGEQCAHFNNDNFNIHGLPKEITWLPKYHGISHEDRCKLFCRVQGSSSYYLLKEKVVDGTPCGHDTFDVCVNGVCIPAGCDRRLHSPKTLDICGVCGGDGSTCRTYRGSFNESKYGYNNIITIPAGASNIDIRQHSFDNTARDDNYLALVGKNDEYILNGNFVVSMFRKTIHYAGSIIEYSGSDSVVEHINSSSRTIQSDLLLQVLSVGKLKPPDIHYQYVISLNYNSDNRGRSNSNYEEAQWSHSEEWTLCSSPCQGSQTRVKICVNTRTGAEIATEYCRNAPRLQEFRRACNTNCTLRWIKVQKACDCINPNKTKVTLKCVRETSTNKIPLSDGYCSRVPKPDPAPDCIEECSRPSWRTTQWSQCSARCGEGTQVRRVWCQRYRMPLDGREREEPYIEVSEAECREAPKPITSRKCDSGACGKWDVGDWSPCSATCGQGISKATLGCYLEGAAVPSDFCHHAPKPTTERPCEADIPCVDWAVMESNGNMATDFVNESSWSECSNRCNPHLGQRTRNLMCVMKRPNWKSPQPTNETHCTRLLGNKPPNVTACDSQIPVDCQQELERQKEEEQRLQREKDWLAFQRRIQKQREERQQQADQRSNQLSLPQTLSDVLGSKKKLEASIFSLPLIKDNSINDNRIESDEWTTTPWSACFKSGTNAIQIREVSCPKTKCHGQRPMNSRACGVWFTSEWNNCNATCDNRIGLERREVKCIQSESDLSYSSELEEQDCLHPKPDNTRPCSAYCRPKGKWRTGPWGKCSRPCGVVQNDGDISVGQRNRQVLCVDEANVISVLPEAECDKKTKPDTVGSCSDTENQPCPIWSVSEWSECMATINGTASTAIPNPKLQMKRLKSPKKKDQCLNEIAQEVWGHRERTVKCQDHNGHEIPEHNCKLLNKRPNHSELCLLSKKHCSTASHYRWRVGNWSDCSKNCGSKGTKNRTVECTKIGGPDKGMNATTVVDDKLCLRGGKRRKPKVERGCARYHCPFKWISTDWSECSRTCGYGIQRRQVTCHKVNRLGWLDPDPVIHGCENIEKPKEYNYCMISENCSNSSISYAWKTEEWSECPPSLQICGHKGPKVFQRRKVHCAMNGIRTPQRYCEKLTPKPVRRKRCPKNPPCGWKTCMDVKEAGNYYDGEYMLLVGGKNMSIYCHGLNSDNPKEYLTLPIEALSEIYDKRLIRPETCPRNGRRLDSCECVQDRNRRSGLTTWSKIRLNVTNLRVDTEDFSFAQSTGDLIAFGMAGDCYSSSMSCPQGKFSIDLRGSKLTISTTTSWVSQGHKPTIQITKASDNQHIEGKCGGYCGTCSPNRSTGLKMEVVI